jgi:hypothetical protein
MKPHLSAGAVLAAAFLALPVVATSASVKQRPSAFGTEHKPEGAAREANEPSGAAELEDRRPKKKKEIPAIHRAGRGARGGKVKIKLDGDMDGGGDDLGSEAGFDPDAGNF